MKTSLTEVSKACGCDNVIECNAEETYEVMKNALKINEMTIIISKCDSGNIKVPPIELDPVMIKNRFMNKIKS